MREKEEEHKMQKNTLDNELHHLREQLTLSAKEIELLKGDRQRKEREQLTARQELQDKVQQLQKECNELGQRASVETQLRGTQADEVAALQAALEREKNGRRKEIHDLKMRHGTEKQRLITEHTQKLNDMKLSHAEDLRRREEEVEAQYAGEMAYLKLHHNEMMEEMKARQNSNVERIVSEHHQLMSPKKHPVQQHTVSTDLVNESLLMKIAELAPVLAREAREVNELCKTSGQMTTHSQSEIQQLQAQLTSKQKQFEGLNRDLARKDASLSQSEEQRSALHHDLELVRRRNEELQGELSKAHQQLAKMEASMTKATSTVKLLKKELEESRARESGLERNLSKEGASMAQLRDQVRQESLCNQQLSSDLGTVKRELSGIEQRLRASETAKTALEQRLQQIQSELREARESAKRSEAALRDKTVEVEKLSTNKQQESGSFQTALQAKEMELTKAMDKLLQEKVASAKANSELTSVTAELTRALAETESVRQQMDTSRMSDETEIEGAKHELEKMLSHCKQLESQLKDATSRLQKTEHLMNQSNMEKDALQQRYDELSRALHSHLNRSLLLTKAYKKEVLDKMDAKEMISELLKQEEAFFAAHDSLKDDNNRLSHEVKRLQREIEKWKNLVSLPSRPDGAKPEHKLQLLQEEIMRLFALYRQAEMHRKALIVQKRYLQCQVDAFFQTQQSALLLMADMGAPVNLDSYPHHRSKYPRGYARFRAVGCVVIATLRFRYVVRRKLHHLKSQISKLQRNSRMPSTPSVRAATTATVTGDENFSGSAASGISRHVSPIGLSTGIQTVPSGHPTSATRLSAPTSWQSHPSVSSSTSPSLRHQEYKPSMSTKSQRGGGPSVPRVKPLQHHQDTHPPTKPLSSAVSGAGKSYTSASLPPSVHSGNAQSAKLSTKVPADSPQDPQLTAYIKGLEGLKARLSKTNV